MYFWHDRVSAVDGSAKQCLWVAASAATYAKARHILLVLRLVPPGYAHEH